MIDKTAKAVRLAGSALKQYFTDPATYQQLGNKVALDTALGTATSQVVPRVLGVQAPGIRQTALNTVMHSAISHPVTGGLTAVGVTPWASQVIGQTAGGVGTQLLSGAMRQNGLPNQSAQNVITPEMAQYMQLQRFNAEMEEHKYRNQINLAAVRNYSPPTEIVHRNPSAEFSEVMRVLNPPSVQYG